MSRLFLSKAACQNLGIIGDNFSEVGSSDNASTSATWWTQTSVTAVYALRVDKLQNRDALPLRRTSLGPRSSMYGLLLRVREGQSDNDHTADIFSNMNNEWDWAGPPESACQGDQ